MATAHHRPDRVSPSRHLPSWGAKARGRLFTGIGLFVAVAAAPAGAADLTIYRGHMLGSSVDDVLRVSHARPSDVTTVHEQPSRIQTLDWRTPYTSAGTAAADPVEAITFSFVDGQLYEMRVAYDRSRTDSLTTADLVAGVSEVYGPAATPPAGSGRLQPRMGVASTLARWEDAAATVALMRGPYGDLHLIVRSMELEGRARIAIAAALAQHAAEEPARLQKARAAAEAAGREERTRNKAGFRP